MILNHSNSEFFMHEDNTVISRLVIPQESGKSVYKPTQWLSSTVCTKYNMSVCIVSEIQC